MKKKRNISPLPFSYYFVPCLLLVLIGLFSSLYLSISHYRVYTDIGYSSFCAISKAINCDTVSQSPYSIFLELPVPVWGVWGYLFFLAAIIPAGLKSFRPSRLWRLLFLLAALFSVISIILAGLSSFVIHSYCIMCIVTYGVNFGLFFYAWLIPRRFDHQSIRNGLKADLRMLVGRKPFYWAAAAYLLLLVGVWALIPAYWRFIPPSNDVAINSGFTEDGHPWIGADTPDVTIVEFADYQCFQCRKMHLHLRSLVQRYPDRIRLVHRHFPMDSKVNPVVQTPFHESSSVLAVLAIQAGLKNKFWEANDALYDLVARKIQRFDTAELASTIGLTPQELNRSFNDPTPYNKMVEDLRDGIRLGIVGTPTYVIDGQLFEGGIPPDILSDILSLNSAHARDGKIK